MMKLNFEYTKLYLKEILILLPKFHQNLISFLTPTLGLYGINVKEFINEIENKTQYINYDIVIPLKVTLSKIKTYEVNIKTPYISTLLYNHENFTETSLELDILTLYKLSVIKSIHNNIFTKQKTMIYYKMIKSSLKSMNRDIVQFIISKKKQKNSLSFLNNLYKSEDYINKLFSIRKMIIEKNKISHLINNKFGIFYFFPGLTNKKFLKLKDTLMNYNVNVIKLHTKLASTVILNKIHGVVVYAYTNKFSYFINYLKKVKVDSGLQMKIFNVRFFNNLLIPDFLLKYIKLFDSFDKYFVNKQLLFFRIFNLLMCNYIHTLKLNYTNQIKILRLLEVIKTENK